MCLLFLKQISCIICFKYGFIDGKTTEIVFYCTHSYYNHRLKGFTKFAIKSSDQAALNSFKNNRKSDLKKQEEAKSLKRLLNTLIVF